MRACELMNALSELPSGVDVVCSETLTLPGLESCLFGGDDYVNAAHSVQRSWEISIRRTETMDRLTERDEYGNADIIALSDVMPELYAELSFSETNALTDALNRLAAYEDTNLYPSDIFAIKSQYSDTFQAHLNEMCDIKDKRIAELEAENARLHKLVDNIECVMRGE